MVAFLGEGALVLMGLAKLPSLERLPDCSPYKSVPLPACSPYKSVPQPLALTLTCTSKTEALGFARLTGDSAVELRFHLHLPNYEHGWAAPRVLWSHLYFLLRDRDDLNMMARWNLFSWQFLQASICLSLPFLHHVFPKVEEELLGGGRQDTIVLELGVTTTYSG